MNVYQSSLLGDEDENQQISGFGRVVDIMVDPAVEICLNVAEEKSKLRPRWDMSVFVLNCLGYLLVSHLRLICFGLQLLYRACWNLFPSLHRSKTRYR